jgi:phosphomannomutase
MPHTFHPSILREYDIRGIYGQTLFDADAYALGRAFARYVRGLCGKAHPCVVVGYDGRLSSPALAAALVAGLCDAGCDVRSIGLGPTPMLYFAEASMDEVEGGIQVTGSHNPADHNGFKIVCGGRALFGPAIVELGRLAGVEQAEIGRKGVDRDVDVSGAYVERLLGALEGVSGQALGALRLGWDTGNGAAGPILTRVLARLPGENLVLFAEVDGHFPNHHPDPTEDANLADLRNLLESNRLDFGLAFDGDGDRVVLVDGKGRALAGDQLLAIAAADVLAKAPGATVVADVKTSRAVFDSIAAHGGKPLMWKAGHSLIKSKMKETGALLGGEMSGHLFFADTWYGFDDGIYAALRVIAALLRAGTTPGAWLDAQPPSCTTPELRFAVADEAKFAVVAAVGQLLAVAGVAANRVDGLRVDTEDGWWLLRASNTQAMLTARAESGSAKGLARLLAQLDGWLAQVGVSRHAAPA